MENNDKKKIIITIMGVIIFVLSLVGISFAFFYYTSVSPNVNTFQTGSISFVAEYNELNLNNAFPVSAQEAEETAESTSDVGIATVSITGKTNYTYGIDFTVTVEDIESTTSSDVPISLIIGNPVGENADKITLSNKATKLPSEGSTLFQGHIASVSKQEYSTTNINGVIAIKAYIDVSDVLISDTDTAEPPRQVVSTSDWNNKGISFKIKVVATEGNS